MRQNIFSVSNTNNDRIADRECAFGLQLWSNDDLYVIENNYIYRYVYLRVFTSVS